jgi:hypothetical protein
MRVERTTSLQQAANNGPFIDTFIFGIDLQALRSGPMEV